MYTVARQDMLEEHAERTRELGAMKERAGKKIACEERDMPDAAAQGPGSAVRVRPMLASGGGFRRSQRVAEA